MMNSLVSTVGCHMAIICMAQLKFMIDSSLSPIIDIGFRAIVVVVVLFFGRTHHITVPPVGGMMSRIPVTHYS